MNEHRGIYNRLSWMLEKPPIDQDDRVLQKTPYTFDVSIWEFFWPHYLEPDWSLQTQGDTRIVNTWSI